MAKNTIFGDADIETDAEFTDSIAGDEEVSDFGSMMANATNGNIGKLSELLKGMDLSKIKDGFTIIPDDTECIFSVKKIDVTVTKKGDNMLRLTLEVVEPEEYKGSKVWDNIVLTTTSLWKFKAAAKAADLLASDGSTFIGDSHIDFINKELVATVIEGEYLKPGESTPTPNNKIKGGYRHVNTYNKEVSTPKFG